MKRKSFPALILITVLIAAACKNSPESDDTVATAPKELADEKGASYIIDTQASSIEWIGTKVSGYHEGKVSIKSGRLTVKNNGIASGTFVLDVANITVTGPKESKVEGNNKLEGHLKSADFFDVGKFPEGTFEITSVQPYTET